MVNHQVFEQTTFPFVTHLFAYASYLTMNSENAKDLMQDTYLKAYRFWEKYEQGTNIKAWLFCIMRNTYINYYRKESKEPRKVEYQEYHVPYNSSQEGAIDHTALLKKTYDEIFDDEITRSIGSLKDPFKNILLLSDVEGLSYKEIAKVMNCPIGTVRSRLFRCRTQLKKKLSCYAKDHRYIQQCKSFM